MINIKKIFWLLLCNNIVLHIVAMDSQPNMSTLIGQLKKSAHYGIAPHVTNTIITAHNNNNNQHDQLVVDNGIIQDHQNQKDMRDKRFKNIFDSVPLEIALEIAQYLDWSQYSEFNHRLAVNLIKRAQDGNRLDTIPQPIFAFVAKQLKKNIRKNPTRAVINDDPEIIKTVLPTSIFLSDDLKKGLCSHLSRKKPYTNFSCLKFKLACSQQFRTELTTDIINGSSIACTIDNKILIGSLNGKLYTYDGHTGLLESEQQYLPTGGKEVHIHEKGNYFAINYPNNKLLICTLAHPKHIQEINSKNTLAFYFSNNYLITAYSDKFTFRNLLNNHCFTIINSTKNVVSVTVSEKNNTIIIVDQDIAYSIYDLDTGLLNKNVLGKFRAGQYHDNNICIWRIRPNFSNLECWFDQASDCPMLLNLMLKLDNDHIFKTHKVSADSSQIIGLHANGVLSFWKLPFFIAKPTFESKLLIYALKHSIKLGLDNKDSFFRTLLFFHKIRQKVYYKTLSEDDKEILDELLCLAIGDPTPKEIFALLSLTLALPLLMSIPIVIKLINY